VGRAVLCAPWASPARRAEDGPPYQRLWFTLREGGVLAKMEAAGFAAVLSHATEAANGPFEGQQHKDHRQPPPFIPQRGVAILDIGRRRRTENRG